MFKKTDKDSKRCGMNFAIMNAQSLKFKLDSLAENFQMNKNDFILTSETWFKHADKQLKMYLEKMEDKNELFCIRKDRKLGKSNTALGGVAFFYDKSRADFKKFPLNSLRGSDVREHEILCCRRSKERDCSL